MKQNNHERTTGIEIIVAIAVTLIFASSLSLIVGHAQGADDPSNQLEAGDEQANETETPTETQQAAENGSDAARSTPTPAPSPTPTTTSTSTPEPDQDVDVSVEQDSTPTQTPTSTSINTSTVEQSVGDLVIHDVHWPDDESAVVVEVTHRGRSPTTLSITEMVDPSGGSVQVGIDRTRLRPDKPTRVRVSLNKQNAVLVYTEESLEDQQAAVLDPGDGPLQPPTESDRLALVVGAVSTLGFALLINRRKEELDDRGIRRVDE